MVIYFISMGSEFCMIFDVIGAIIYAGKNFLLMQSGVVEELLYLFLFVEVLLFYLFMFYIFYYSYRHNRRVRAHLDQIDRRFKWWRRRRGEINYKRGKGL